MIRLAVAGALLLATPALAIDPTDVAAVTDSGTPAPAPAVASSGAGITIGGLPPALAETAAAVRTEPFVDRVVAVSAQLLGLPYVSDPMGEGAGRDLDPFARYDAFDCLTFVEEVTALALSGDPAHAADVRLGLRYGDSPPDYGTRHHFMELQWIPQAVANGWLRETTGEYGPTRRYEREVTPAMWSAWSRRHLFALTDAELPVGTMALDYLPRETALAVADRIRPGSIIMTVLEDRAWIPLWITHVGFVIPGDSETMLRHATFMPSSRTVRDSKLAWYLDHLGTYVNRPAVGIAIYEPVEAGPRLSRLPR